MNLSTTSTRPRSADDEHGGTSVSPRRCRGTLPDRGSEVLRELDAAHAHGDLCRRRRAEDAAVVQFLAVATSVARRYRWRGVDVDDLEQVARIGLVKAVRRWQPERGRFLSYALPTIEGEVKRYFRDNGSTIRMPRTLYEMQPRVTAAVKDLRQEKSCEPSTTEIADRAGLSCDQVQQVQKAVIACWPLTTDGPEPSLRLPSAAADRDMSMVELRTRLRSALATLTDRERKIVLLRFVWDQSQVQIAGALGLSQMQISRLLRGALTKLASQIDEDIEI